MEGFLVFFILIYFWRKPLKPGVLLSIWGLSYSAMRILGEQFRMPDAHIGYEWLGLTRGQWLSVFMFLIFAFLLYWSSKRKAEKLGGWGQLIR
jgi:phosphatidylglycerol:prolipoprotein diacylglycerol transferase